MYAMLAAVFDPARDGLATSNMTGLLLHSVRKTCSALRPCDSDDDMPEVSEDDNEENLIPRDLAGSSFRRRELPPPTTTSTTSSFTHDPGKSFLRHDPSDDGDELLHKNASNLRLILAVGEHQVCDIGRATAAAFLNTLETEHYLLLTTKLQPSLLARSAVSWPRSKSYDNTFDTEMEGAEPFKYGFKEGREIAAWSQRPTSSMHSYKFTLLSLTVATWRLRSLFAPLSPQVFRSRYRDLAKVLCFKTCLSHLIP